MLVYHTYFWYMTDVMIFKVNQIYCQIFFPDSLLECTKGIEVKNNYNNYRKYHEMFIRSMRLFCRHCRRRELKI